MLDQDERFSRGKAWSPCALTARADRLIASFAHSFPMRTRFQSAFDQFRYLGKDLNRISSRGFSPWLTFWASRQAMTVFCYRHSRFWLLLMGPAFWLAARALISPITFLIRPWVSHCELHPEADIGPGLWVVHPSLGVVVSRQATIGANCTLFGGNVVGIRGKLEHEKTVVIGDKATFGVNAVVLGPLRLGNRVQIGAGAVVTRDAPDGSVLTGVPAQPLASPGRGTQGWSENSEAVALR